MMIDVRRKKAERNTTNSKKHDLRANKAGRDRTDSQKREPKLKRERKSSKQHLTERELSQVMGGVGDPGPGDPPYGSQQHNEHHLRWKKDRTGRSRFKEA